MKSRIFLVALAVVMIGGVTATVLLRGPAHGSISPLIIKQSVLELTQHSTDVLYGTVSEIRPAQRTTNKLTGDVSIYHDILLTVTKPLKGKAGETVVIRVPGGTYGSGRNAFTLEVEDVPIFAPGEHVLVFLSKGTDGFFELPDGYYVVSGWVQGKYQINGNQAANVERSVPIAQIEQEIRQAL